MENCTFVVLCSVDMKEHLKCVLSPYQKGGQEVDSEEANTLL